ncbi:hypothetical protein CRI93_09470 [Longimonas halophila]|uniref:Glycosyltransferase 2-like domain-containing protein n=1 Tax=Longimonas halophila TaxID=1469170 RepID=A0A2H3NS31_9BACT|nr:glycosyltransferase family A protein [Longimonas halophila]PEN06501.1 hypothetical protein CRI93_09470 [Longimonas halophila]
MPSEVEMLDFEAFKERYEKVPVEEYPNNVREAVPDPVVSVHLLTYNHADYIREAIESVLMQEVDFPMEIVLGDDDSSDGTREICIEYAEQYPDLIRLQLHHRENNIHLHGRPTHLFQYWYNTFSARGKYIAILSGDDYWTDPLKLQKQHDFLQANSEYALSFHDAKVAADKGKVVSESKTPDENKRDFSSEDMMSGAYFPALSLFVLNIFEQVPEKLIFCINEDKVTISLLARYGKGHFQEEIDPAVYRVHDSSIWSSKTPLIRVKANNDTLKNMLSVCDDRSTREDIESKILGSCVSLVSRLVFACEVAKALKELTDTLILFAKRKKLFNMFLLLSNLTRFLGGSIKNCIRAKYWRLIQKLGMSAKPQTR